MFCTNCGKPNDDGAVYCTNCGAPLGVQTEGAVEGNTGYIYQGEAADYAPYEQQPANRKLSAKTLGIIGAAAAVVLLAILIALMSVNSWKRTVKSYMTAVKKYDTPAMFDYYPKAYVDYILDDNDATLSEYKEDIKDRRDDLIEMLEEELDDDYDMTLKGYQKSISYTIKKDDDFSKKELREVNELFEDRYDTKENYVKAGKHVKLKVSRELDGKTNSSTFEFDIIKVGGKWYVSPFNSPGRLVSYLYSNLIY